MPDYGPPTDPDRFLAWAVAEFTTDVRAWIATYGSELTGTEREDIEAAVFAVLAARVCGIDAGLVRFARSDEVGRFLKSTTFYTVKAEQDRVWRRHESDDDGITHSMSSDELGPEETSALRADLHQVIVEVGKLPPKQRHALGLSLHEVPQSQAAEQMNISVRHYRNLLRQAQATLRRLTHDQA